MRRWSGYTLASLADADAHELMTTWALVTDAHIGEAENDDGESG